MSDNKLTVLVVDDAPENIDVINEILSDYKVKAALNGDKALKILEKGGIDLVLLDIKMPGMDGLEVLSLMKENETLKHIAVAMLSGSENGNEQEKARSLGALEFFQKPVNPAQLKEFINSIR